VCLHVLKAVNVSKQRTHLKGLKNMIFYFYGWLKYFVYSSCTLYGNCHLSVGEMCLIFVCGKSLMIVYTVEAQTFIKMVSLMKA